MRTKKNLLFFKTNIGGEPCSANKIWCETSERGENLGIPGTLYNYIKQLAVRLVQ